MPIQKNRLYTIFVAVLFVGLVYFAWQYFSLLREMQSVERAVNGQQINKKVLNFSELFINNVLQGGKTVTFDQRLELENAVRDIKDPDIYAAWQKFTNSKDQEETQQNFYNLFSLLLKKPTS